MTESIIPSEYFAKGKYGAPVLATMIEKNDTQHLKQIFHEENEENLLILIAHAVVKSGQPKELQMKVLRLLDRILPLLFLLIILALINQLYCICTRFILPNLGPDEV